MCDRVFSDNRLWGTNNLTNELEHVFKVDKIIFIPTHPDDFTGHSDGVVRFIKEDTVVINDYSKEKRYGLQLRLALNNASCNFIELPYNPYNSHSYTSARGEYINYVELNDTVIMPIFELHSDNRAYYALEKVFKYKRLVTLNCNSIARFGGAVNCISWNIFLE